ncbi:ergothioneine biosynthesis protein EgtC [Kitasatospora sp. NPDC048239]|uniref:ergothioneine biosynthesis protein EgtC n=1 Tax=Kitasatospora sp. NPDC048239 TaxID=3364046 RepID=UPI00370F8983
MCRHLAYLGAPVTPRELLVEPPFGLYRQSWAPRTQRYGTVNADGFGLGWYADGDEVPARYRRAGPIWADASFADLARVIRTRALLAAVRSATEGCAAGETAAAPFAAGRWLFSHNGAVDGWPAKLDALAALLPPAELLALEARTDSALLWGLALHRLRAGAGLGEALAGAVADTAAHTTGRLNLLLTDGRTLAATAWGDTLHHRTLPDGAVLVASEPFDDDPAWTAVPDRSLLLAGPDGITVRPL